MEGKELLPKTSEIAFHGFLAPFFYHKHCTELSNCNGSGIFRFYVVFLKLFFWKIYPTTALYLKLASLWLTRQCRHLNYISFLVSKKNQQQLMSTFFQTKFAEKFPFMCWRFGFHECILWPFSQTSRLAFDASNNLCTFFSSFGILLFSLSYSFPC